MLLSISSSQKELPGPDAGTAYFKIFIADSVTEFKCRAFSRRSGDFSVSLRKYPGSVDPGPSC
jgi:hypothetical protein